MSIVYYTFSSPPRFPLKASSVSSESLLDQSAFFLALVSLEEQVGGGAPNSFIPKSKVQCLITSSLPTAPIPPEDQGLYKISTMPVFDSSGSATGRKVQVYTPSTLIPGESLSPSSTTAQITFVLNLVPKVQISFAWAQRLKAATNGVTSIPIVETPWNQIDTFESLYLVILDIIYLSRCLLTLLSCRMMSEINRQFVMQQNARPHSFTWTKFDLAISVKYMKS